LAFSLRILDDGLEYVPNFTLPRAAPALSLINHPVSESVRKEDGRYVIRTPYGRIVDTPANHERVGSLIFIHNGFSSAPSPEIATPPTAGLPQGQLWPQIARQWATTIGGSGFDILFDLVTDGVGNVVVTGMT